MAKAARGGEDAARDGGREGREGGARGGCAEVGSRYIIRPLN